MISSDVGVIRPQTGLSNVGCSCRGNFSQWFLQDVGIWRWQEQSRLLFQFILWAFFAGANLQDLVVGGCWPYWVVCQLGQLELALLLSPSYSCTTIHYPNCMGSSAGWVGVESQSTFTSVDYTIMGGLPVVRRVQLAVGSSSAQPHSKVTVPQPSNCIRSSGGWVGVDHTGWFDCCESWRQC